MYGSIDIYQMNRRVCKSKSGFFLKSEVASHTDIDRLTTIELSGVEQIMPISVIEN